MRSLIAPLVLLALAGPAHAAAPVKPEPLVLSKGQRIGCGANPFGSQLTLGFEQEVVVTRWQTSGQVTHHQFDRNTSNNSLLLQRQNVGLGNVTRLRTVSLDLNGDGRQEMAVIGAQSTAPGTLLVRILRPSGTDGTANELAGTYSWATGATTIDAIEAAAGDLDGSADGRQELAIAVRRGFNGPYSVIALNGDGNGLVAQANNTFLARWDQPTAEVATSNNARIAVGDLLQEGRDQAIMVSTRENNFGVFAYNVLRFEDVDNPNTPAQRFDPSPLFTEVVGGGAVTKLSVHVADLGGDSRRELVIHDQRSFSGSVLDTRQLVRYFDVTRSAENGGQMTDFDLVVRPGLTQSIPTPNSPFAASVANFDRTPGAEIAFTYRNEQPNSLVTLVQKVQFDGVGEASGIDSPSTPFARFASAVTSDPLTQIEASSGDADGDSLFEHYVVFRDIPPGGGQEVTRVWRLGFGRPSPVAGPVVPSTFGRTASYDFSALADTSAIAVNTADWNNDSVLAQIGVECRRVEEPQVRSVVSMPPYWSRLQSGLDGFGASIGRSVTSGTASGSQYDTFSSHDVSAYLGLQVGGEVLGIGASVTAKATAGYNYETTRSVFNESAFETTATQSQFSSSVDGEGLVVVELNTYDCYDFAVFRSGEVVDDSDFRACELIRFENEVPLRSLVSTDLYTWDTATAAGEGTRPAQWFPLHQDWSNLALFHPVVLSGPGNGSFLTDGRFNTVVQMAQNATSPFAQIDLGDVRDITAIRVWPSEMQQNALRGFRLFVSETPFSGPALPSGPGVRSFDPDELTQNGVDSWSVWTRDDQNGAAPLRGRYIRLQHPAAAAIRLREIQVFGDVHKEPPSYPVEVCDPVRNDGLFNVVVADKVSQPAAWRVIDVRGDLAWSSVVLAPGQPGSLGCPGNAAGVPAGSIWESTLISATTGAGAEWNLENRNQQFFENATSISHSYRVGAELDVEAGAVVQVVGGGAYEYSQGVTRTETTSMTWGTGMQYGGSAVNWATGTGAGCAYAPRPFSYVQSDSANSGYGHRYTVVDYVVRPSSATWNPIGPNFPPVHCFPAQSDVVFESGFEP
jgi:hypothetical protein